MRTLGLLCGSFLVSGCEPAAKIPEKPADVAPNEAASALPAADTKTAAEAQVVAENPATTPALEEPSTDGHNRLTPDEISQGWLRLFDGSTAELIQYNDCEGGSEVWHYKVYNGGHTWPGASIIVGVTNQDFHASAAIWEFFLRHPGAGPSSATDQEDKSEVLAFPNPFSGTLNIRKAGSGEEAATIWNQLGGVQWRGQMGKESQVDTRHWPAGIYWLQAGKQVIALIKN